MIPIKKTYVEQLQELQPGGDGFKAPAEKIISIRNTFYKHRETKFPGWKISIRAIRDESGVIGVWRVA